MTSTPPAAAVAESASPSALTSLKRRNIIFVAVLLGEGRPDRAQVEAALERIGHRMLVQRGWTEDRSDLAAAR